MGWERLPKEAKLDLYRLMFKARYNELTIRKDIKELKRGPIPLALTSIGEEAGSVGATYPLNPARDYLFPGHRSKGAHMRFGVTPLEDLSNHMCKANSPARGREGIAHYTFLDDKRKDGRFITHMLGNWGTALGIAEGIAYEYLISNPKKHAGEEIPLVLCMCGDGASRQGTLHEVMNYAATHNLPMGFVFNNNGIATDTPIKDQMPSKFMYKLSGGYEMEGRYIANGNDIVTVYDHASELIAVARERSRKQLLGTEEKRAPFILEYRTFRIAEHNEARFAECVDLYEFAKWRAMDPIQLYRGVLLRWRNVDALKKIKNRDPSLLFECGEMEFTEAELNQIESEVKQEVDGAYEKAVSMPDPTPDNSLLKIYPSEIIIPKTRDVEPFNAKLAKEASGKDLSKMANGSEALRKVLVKLVKENPNIRIFGEDVAGNIIDGEKRGGGVQGITRDVLRDPEIGSGRVFNTPLAEITITGLAIGQALRGILPIAEYQYMPFASPAVSQLTDFLASHYWATNIPIHAIFRFPCGAGKQTGEGHGSMRLEATFFHTPGLKMLHPATPNDFTGLMMSAVKDDSPILFFENLWGMSGVVGEISGKPVPVGMAALRHPGADLTIAAWGGKTWFDVVLPAVSQLENDGKSIELIDLRTLEPLDLDLLVSSVKKTHRLLIVHEAIKRGGIGESIAQMVQEEAFSHLLAPVRVIGSERCPAPQGANLERWFLPSAEKVKNISQELLRWG